MASIILELQNRAVHYDVVNRATNSKLLFFKILLELVVRDF